MDIGGRPVSRIRRVVKFMGMQAGMSRIGGRLVLRTSGSQDFRVGRGVLRESRGSAGDEIEGLVELLRESKRSAGEYIHGSVELLCESSVHGYGVMDIGGRLD